MAYANEANIVNQDSSINEGRRGEGRGGKLSGWWKGGGQLGEEASRRLSVARQFLLNKLLLCRFCRLTIDESNKFNNSLFQALLTQIKNPGLETVNALLEKRLKILSNVSKESTLSPLWTYMWSLHKRMKFIKSP